MANRNSKTGGTDFTEEGLKPTDLNDTFNAMTQTRTVVGYKMKQFFDFDDTASLQDLVYFIDATVVNSPTLTTIGSLTALTFDGSTEYVNLNASIDSTSTLGFALTAIVKVSTVGTLQNIAGSTDGGTKDIDIQLTAADIISANIRTPTFNTPLTSSTTFIANDVIHIVLNWQSEGIYELWINGVMEDSDATTGIGQDYVRDLYIGALNNTGTAANYFGGDIARFVVYNKALSPGEISYLYNNGNFQTFE